MNLKEHEKHDEHREHESGRFGEHEKHEEHPLASSALVLRAERIDEDDTVAGAISKPGRRYGRPVGDEGGTENRRMSTAP
jgi:hypothetical protein